MSSVFGIYIGNSSVCLAMCKKDDSRALVEVVPDSAGERVMPALVTILEGEIVVGTACKSLMISHWSSTVASNKQLLCKGQSNIVDNRERHKISTVVHNGHVCYCVAQGEGENYLTPVTIAMYIYENLHEMARNVMAMPHSYCDLSCVLLQPSHVSAEVRSEMRQAAEMAGWDVLHIIDEPGAAVMGYRILLDQTVPPLQIIVVYRLGGFSSDATIMELNQGILTTLGNKHSEEVGGKLLIHALTQYLADEFYKKYKLDPRESSRSVMKLTQAAENLLHVLSTLVSANCYIESLYEGVDFSMTISRGRLENLLHPQLLTLTEPLCSLLDNHKLKFEEVSKILLCGGVMKIPHLQRHISGLFREGAVVSLPSGMNHDEVYVCGAALHGACLAKDPRLVNSVMPAQMEIPRLANTVTITVEGADCEEKVIPAETLLPTRIFMPLCSIIGSIKVSICELGESKFCAVAKHYEDESLPEDAQLTVEISLDTGIAVKVISERFKNTNAVDY